MRAPLEARESYLVGLTIAAGGGMADIVKPLLGPGSGVFEIALRFRGDAYRVVYAVRIGEDFQVVHAEEKQSAEGTKTRIRGS